MTVSNPQTPIPTAPYPAEGSPGEDEIDLRQYVLVLVAWWREILLVAVAAAVAAAGGVLLLRLIIPPAYESSAVVAIARTQSNITFDERFKTLTQDDLTAVKTDSAVRRSALVGLVANGAVAQAVIDQLGAQLDEAQRNPAQLLEIVKAKLVTVDGSRDASDLIRITVTADSAQKASAIANAWAEHYVAQVNRIYGQVPGELLASITTELSSTQIEYESAQKALEAFVAQNEVDKLDRLIAEKQDIITSLQAGKQTAIAAIVDEELKARRQIISAYIMAQAQNRLLPFEKEQEAKQKMVSALIDADTTSRLAALQKDQEMRSRLFAQYVDAEISNRLAAFTKEQEAKNQLFNAYVDADVQAKVAVFNKQVQSRIQLLATNYETRAKMERLLGDAQSLRSQAAQAGPASAATNSLAILFLKSEVYASSAALPGNLQITLGSVGDLNAGAPEQLADLDALIQSLNSRITELDLAIAAQSQTLLDNEGYQFLSQARPENDELFAAVKQKYLDLFQVDGLATAADSVADNTSLSTGILDKYNQLFALGPLATGSMIISTTTPVFAAIREQYPDLFTVGSLAALTDQVAQDNPLATLGTERAKELLQLQGLEDLPAYSAAAEPLTQAIDLLDSDIQALQARREAEGSRRQQLAQRRDLAWSTLITLKNKNAELHLATTATNSEVRLAAPAIEPVDPVKGSGLKKTTALAGIVGLMLAVFVAFFANFMGARPFLGRERTTVAG